MRTNTRPGAAPAVQPKPRRMTLEAVKTGSTRGPDRILIYGVGGVGKSTFFSEAPAPIFLDTQDGTSRLDVARFPRPTSWEDVRAAIKTLTDETHDYKTLVIDLVDDVERLIWEHVCHKGGKSVIEDFGYGKGYVAASEEWRLLIRDLELLRRAKGMAIGFVGHSSIASFKNPEGDDYDRYGLSLHKAAVGVIYGWCDTVLFARGETLVHTKEKKTRGISTGARILHTVETAAYYAKNRDNLPDTLPLDWSEFAAAVAASEPASPDAIRAEIEELLGHTEDEKLIAGVRKALSAAGDNAAQLARHLNRLREKVQIAQPQDGE